MQRPAVLNYTDRDFGLGAVTEQRTYRYGSSGVLDIDIARRSPRSR